MVKKICVLLTASLLASTVVCADSEGYTDISGHWAENTIISWSSQGVVNGWDGKFFPDDNITRGQIAVIVDRIMKYDETTENTFADLAQGEFYTDSMLRLYKAGIMQGYENNLRPNDSVTRQEAAVLLKRAYEMQDEAAELTYTDKDNIADWADAAVQTMTVKGIIKGYENRFRPTDYITRAEFLTILDNIKNIIPPSLGMIIPADEIEDSTGISGGTSSSGTEDVIWEIDDDETATPTPKIVNSGSGGGGGGSSSSKATPTPTATVVPTTAPTPTATAVPTTTPTGDPQTSTEPTIEPIVTPTPIPTPAATPGKDSIGANDDYSGGIW